MHNAQGRRSLSASAPLFVCSGSAQRFFVNNKMLIHAFVKGFNGLKNICKVSHIITIKISVAKGFQQVCSPANQSRRKLCIAEIA